MVGISAEEEEGEKSTSLVAVRLVAAGLDIASRWPDPTFISFDTEMPTVGR